MRALIQLRTMSSEGHGLQGKIRFIAFIINMIAVINAFTQSDSLAGFDLKGAERHASYLKTEKEKSEFLVHAKRTYIIAKNNNSKLTNRNNKVSSGTAVCTSCSNIDFEENSISGWTVNGDYAIVSSGIDSFGNFPKVFPGAGRHSLQLNNNSCSNKTNFNSSATRLINVTAQNANLNLHFAMVILNYPHSNTDAAKFKIYLRDTNDKILPCPQFDCYYSFTNGAVGVTNFSNSTLLGANIGNQVFPVSYSPWQTFGMDLSSYIGQTLKLEIECNWCLYSYDWAYCYIDADCKQPAAPKMECRNLPITLTGPSGMAGYRWLAPGTNSIVSLNQNYIVTTQGIYTLQCSPNAGCFSIPLNLFFNIAANTNAQFNFNTKPCNLNVAFMGIPQNGLNINDKVEKWNFGDNSSALSTSTLQHMYASPGTKTVTHIISNIKGCSDTVIRVVKVSAPVSFSVINLSGANSISANNSQVIFGTSTNYNFGNLVYTWYGNGGAVVSPSLTVAQSASYMVVTVDPKTQCSDTNYISVDVDSKFIVPNVFTPNGDGKNDQFKLVAKNLQNVKAIIFDRWGSKVFEGMSEEGNIVWDGTNLNGKACSDGVFFYVIEATGLDGNEYAQNGYLSLFR